MMSEKVRNALGAFAMMVIVAGPILGLIAFVALATGYGPAGASLDDGVRPIVLLVFNSVIGGGVLRALVSIDARLDHRS